MSRIDNRIFRAVVPISGATALIAVYLGMSRLTGGWMVRCPLKWLTGWSCPGCGSQRALMALTRGDWQEALTVNLLLPPAIIYLALLWVGYVWGDNAKVMRMYDAITSAKALAVAAAVIIGWFVVRNLLNL